MTVRPSVLANPKISTGYAAYLQSPHWLNRRLRALDLAKYQCERCHGARGLEVHHRTYERLGREWDQDLEVLCQTCHQEHHIEQASKSPIAVYVKLASDVFYEEPWDSISSLSEELKRRCKKLNLPNDQRQIEKALSLVCGRFHFDLRKLPPRIQADAERMQPKPPCGCAACVRAGVSTLRQRYDPDAGGYLHGEPLRRWYEGRARFRTLARGVVGAPGRHDKGFERLAEPIYYDAGDTA